MADKRITELTADTLPIDTDVLAGVDVTAGQTKKFTWAGIKSTLKTYNDGLYQPTGFYEVISNKVTAFSTPTDVQYPSAKLVYDQLATKQASGSYLTSVAESNLSFTDLTTADSSTTKHGLLLKATAPASGLINVVGIANAETVYSMKPLFDATTPATMTSGGSGAVGTATVAARRDHTHPFTNPAIDTLAAATDITTLNASTTAHGLVVKCVAPAANTLNVVGIANAETAYTNKLILDSSTTPSTQAFGDSASIGTSLVAAHADHKHTMPATTKDKTAITGILKGDGTSITACSNLADVVYLTSSSTLDASKLSGAIPSAVTATTQSANDNSTKIATTAFVQQAVRSVPSKEASKYATTAALPTVVYYNGVDNDGVGATLTGVALGAITLDGNAPIVGDRLLVKNQVSTFQNGIYTVTIVGTAGTVFVLTRALDFNQTIDIKTGASTYVTSGSTLAATTWDVNSADNPVIGTDAITFIQSAGPGSIIAGTGIAISGVTVSIDSTVATLTGSQTLTNKTLTTPVINGAITGTVTPPLTFYSNLNLSEGQMINGRILPSVTSGNLTVALKTLAGTDPSATNPVYVMINGVVRSITGALSITQNAGTSWVNLGSAELATKETDLFTYLGWNATNASIMLAISRIPFANVRNDFAYTDATLEKGVLAVGTTNWSATDVFVNIGRFAATLSAGAGYTWSVPTFTASNLIQAYRDNSSDKVWAPVIAGTGSMTINTITIIGISYSIRGNKVHVELNASFTTAGTGAQWISLTLPFATNKYTGTSCFIYNPGAMAGVIYMSASNSVLIGRGDTANWVIGAYNYLIFMFDYAI